MADDHLISPHGGTLVDLVVDPKEAGRLKAQSAAEDWPSWDLKPGQLCDLELLLCGAFSPLPTFLGQADYESVADKMRLADGTLWPVPITLELPAEFAAGTVGRPLALRDPEGVIIAVLHVDELYQPAGVEGACVSGRLAGLVLPLHYDYRALRLTPAELRADLARRGWRRVAAYQTRHPLHRPQQALTLQAAQQAEANLLIHALVGPGDPGDIDHYTRARCYQHVLAAYPPSMASLAFLNLAARDGGPRQALWQAIIAKNHGCSHYIDEAGEELLAAHADELGVSVVQAPPGGETISHAEVRQRLARGQDLPEGFTFPAVAAELARSYPPRSRQGFTVFFTGFSGSGKSTIANVLLVNLLEMGGRPVSMLDGDVVRKHLSSELTFSKEHRDINIRRIGYVASEITKNGGIAICAPIAPYDATRKDVRRMVEAGGGFVLVHVATSIEECEARDRKGFYAKARAGIIKEFTGISDPYEVPADAEMTIDTKALSASEAAHEIVLYLEREGYITAT